MKRDHIAYLFYAPFIACLLVAWIAFCLGSVLMTPLLFIPAMRKQKRHYLSGEKVYIEPIWNTLKAYNQRYAYCLKQLFSIIN